MTLQFETTPLLNRSNTSSSVNMAGQPMKKYGKLVLVDLAGSERLKASFLYLHLRFPFVVPADEPQGTNQTLSKLSLLHMTCTTIMEVCIPAWCFDRSCELHA